jgi:hypothetical protein
MPPAAALLVTALSDAAVIFELEVAAELSRLAVRCGAKMSRAAPPRRGVAR